MIESKCNQSEGHLTLEFPERVVSTNVSLLKQSVFDYLETDEIQLGNWKKMTLLFDKTQMIDSLGLNLLVSIIQWCDERKVPITAHVRHEFVNMVFTSVWLDQKMEILPITE